MKTVNNNSFMKQNLSSLCLSRKIKYKKKAKRFDAQENGDGRSISAFGYLQLRDIEYQVTFLEISWEYFVIFWNLLFKE